MFDPEQLHDPEFLTRVQATRALIAERVRRGVATSAEHLAVVVLDEMPAEHDPAWNRSPTICGESGTTRSSDPRGSPRRATSGRRRRCRPSRTARPAPRPPGSSSRGGPRYQHRRRRPRGDVGPLQGAHLAPTQARHEEQPSPRSPRFRATSSDSTPRPRRGGRWQVARTAAGQPPRRGAPGHGSRSDGSRRAPGWCVRRPGSARRRGGRRGPSPGRSGGPRPLSSSRASATSRSTSPYRVNLPSARHVSKIRFVINEALVQLTSVPFRS